MPENEPKGPQGPIGTPQDDKNYFFKLPGYEHPSVEKRIFELSPIEKVGVAQGIWVAPDPESFRINQSTRLPKLLLASSRECSFYTSAHFDIVKE